MTTQSKHASHKTTITLILVYSMSVTISFAQQGSRIVNLEGGNHIYVNDKKVESPLNQTFGGIGSTTEFRTTQGISATLAANENKQTIAQNSIHEVKIAQNKEEHTTIDGWVRHFKSPSLPSEYKYRAYGTKGTYTPVKHTTFTISVNDQGTTFNAEEGKIKIVRKIPVKIDGKSNNQRIDHSKVLFTTEVYELSAEDGSYTSPLNPSPREYGSYEEARNNLNNPSEPEDYVLYGELLLDDGQEDEAIPYFYQALEMYDPFFDDQLIAEAYLNLAEAYWIIGDNDANVKTYTNRAIGLIEPNLIINLEDLKYAVELGDQALVNEIAFDLYFNYDNLGWAYELLENQPLADQYFIEADKYDWDY